MNSILRSAFLLALLGAALVAQADSFTETVNFPGPNNTSGPTDFNNSPGTTAGPGGTQLYYFDSASGYTLNSIAFTYRYAFSSQITIVSTGPASGTVRTESGAQFGASDAGVRSALNSAVNTNTSGVTFGVSTLAPVAFDVLGTVSSYNFGAAGGTLSVTSQGNGSNSFTSSSASILAAFSRAGGGTFTPLFSTLTGLVATSTGGNAQLSQSATATGTLTLTYNYSITPPQTTPEPSALAALGLGAVAFVKRRRRA